MEPPNPEPKLTSSSSRVDSRPNFAPTRLDAAGQGQAAYGWAGWPSGAGTPSDGPRDDDVEAWCWWARVWAECCVEVGWATPRAAPHAVSDQMRLDTGPTAFGWLAGWAGPLARYRRAARRSWAARRSEGAAGRDARVGACVSATGPRVAGAHVIRAPPARPPDDGGPLSQSGRSATRRAKLPAATEAWRGEPSELSEEGGNRTTRRRSLIQRKCCETAAPLL